MVRGQAGQVMDGCDQDLTCRSNADAPRESIASPRKTHLLNQTHGRFFYRRTEA